MVYVGRIAKQLQDLPYDWYCPSVCQSDVNILVNIGIHVLEFAVLS